MRPLYNVHPVKLPNVLSLILAAFVAVAVRAAEVEVLPDIAYKSGELTDYEQQRCKLDLYLPPKREGFASLVWLHGGGLTGGTKDSPSTKAIARSLADGGIAVAVANYRLSPHAKFPAYIEDIAAVVAWMHSQIAEHGGAPNCIFVGGHSAGAYLSMMVGLDARHLAAVGLKPGDIAGLVPVSGQTMTHYTVREERGLPKQRIIADEAAPIFHVAKQTPPMLIIMGDRDWPGRLEENLYFAAAMKVAGNTGVQFLKVENRDHGGIGARIANSDDPARLAILEFISSALREREGAR